MKIIVGISGGVDSSVAAKLLLEQGHEVCGVTFRMFGEKIRNTGIQVVQNEERILDEGAQAARVLGIPHRVYDFSMAFERDVVEYFVESYRCGETPNPCYLCNKRIKFGLFLDYALRDGFDAVATGHYAKLSRNTAGQYVLERGVDSQKDQSYFLALLSQYQLSKTLFPLAELTKDEVRQIAAAAGLGNAYKADSQDICFVPGGDYTAVIDVLAPGAFPAGDFIDIHGKKIGTHRGLHRYTIGQRRGLALPFGYPVYVVAKSAVGNTVTVGTEQDMAAAACTVRDVNWIAGVPQEPFYAEVKTRYRQQLKKARIELLGDTSVRVVFEVPERAVACGQAAVFYAGNAVLGGGIIADTQSTAVSVSP